MMKKSRELQKKREENKNEHFAQKNLCPFITNILATVNRFYKIVYVLMLFT